MKSATLFTFTLLFQLCRPEIFTSTSSLEFLVHIERQLTDGLRKYIDSEQNRLAKISQFVRKVETAHKLLEQSSDVESFVGHPVNAYLLIKRFASEWGEVEKLLEQDNSQELLSLIDEFKSSFPDYEDYEGAIVALLRLQDTYQLKASDLVKGYIPGVRLTANKMSLNDIFEVGRVAYVHKDMFYTMAWMNEALKKYMKQEDKEGVSKFDIMDHLSFAEYQNGNVKRALNLSLEMLRLEPLNERVQSNVHYFQQEIRKYRQTGQRGDTGAISDIPKPTTLRNSWQQSDSFQTYEALCRGEVRNLTESEKRKMKCWYKNDVPRLILKPQPVELVFLSPEVKIFRNILKEKEMEKIKEMAYPRLRRATIQHPETGFLEVAEYRVSKSGWLRDEEDKLIASISRRIEDVTDLTTKTAEELQVANYGIGGQYEPHFDHAREDEDKFSTLGTGNRIATMLFYMSYVQAGGGTAFVNAGTAVFPSKGDGLFWHNLKKNGLGDDRTRHAGCPVLVGNKWVANKWLHERGQEFKMPCGLKRNEYILPSRAKRSK